MVDETAFNCDERIPNYSQLIGKMNSRPCAVLGWNSFMLYLVKIRLLGALKSRPILIESAIEFRKSWQCGSSDINFNPES